MWWWWWGEGGVRFVLTQGRRRSVTWWRPPPGRPPHPGDTRLLSASRRPKAIPWLVFPLSSWSCPAVRGCLPSVCDPSSSPLSRGCLRGRRRRATPGHCSPSRASRRGATRDRSSSRPWPASKGASSSTWSADGGRSSEGTAPGARWTSTWGTRVSSRAVTSSCCSNTPISSWSATGRTGFLSTACSSGRAPPRSSCPRREFHDRNLSYLLGASLVYSAPP
ncbi:hypothetical protein AAG570_005831 [Ranatra chinensis]|uniref:Uncharacterized protein n=1 Tax=Ranatra chinensis TaxID=642074 RepID=A0ABD0XYK3_9HEMI